MEGYYGSISFSGRIDFGVKAKDEKEAKRLVYELISMNIDSENEDILEISDVTWDLINEAPRGNIATPFMENFQIYREGE